MADVVIAYIPAVHQGYVRFLRQNPGKVLVLGPNFIKEAPRMERDIRALEPTETVDALRALGFDAYILASESEIHQILHDVSIAMPDEDLHRDFASKYLANKKVRFEPVFLRWDRQAVLQKSQVPPDRQISHGRLDQELMSLAQDQATKSPDWWRQVGAIIVRDGRPILVGHNQHAFESVNVLGDPRSNFDAGEYIELSKALHAEAGLIAQAARRGLALDGASLYVTTFPCPVCAKSVAAAGIKKVYYSEGYSLLDAEDILRASGVELIFVDMKNPRPKTGE